MKLFYYLLLSFTLVSCKPTAFCNLQSDFTTISRECPTDGDCTLELLPNKKLTFITDKYGMKYPEITEGKKTVLIYTYNRIYKEKRPDGYYTEKVFAELEPNTTELNLKDEDLKEVKLHFARLCFCKGETGYYAVNQGRFNFKLLKNDSLNVSAKFKVKKIPQVISSFNQTISLK
ncbi:MAG TPA: hypothetical protein VJ970_06725 [Flavobacteriaceae bacterium]|nr:hypothetical protein [Flavobacteriaceae bacterium]